jgi:hypothetical protein
MLSPVRRRRDQFIIEHSFPEAFSAEEAFGSRSRGLTSLQKALNPPGSYGLLI